MARKGRYTASENTGKRRSVPLIRYARHPMFLRGMRDVFLCRGITVEQSMRPAPEQGPYCDGRQFAAMFPYITVPEVRKGREDEALEHVMRALETFLAQSYVSPGIGGRVFERWLEEQGMVDDGNTG